MRVCGMKQKTDFEKWLEKNERQDDINFFEFIMSDDLEKAGFSILSDRELLELLIKLDDDESPRILESETAEQNKERIKEWFANWKKERLRE